MSSAHPESVLLKTVYFDVEARADAHALGVALYRRLTRGGAHPLDRGPRVPVRVAVAAAEAIEERGARTVLVPVLGRAAAQMHRRDVVDALARWRDEEGVTVCPVGVGAAWSGRATGEVTAWVAALGDDAEASVSPLNDLGDAIAIAVGRALGGQAPRVVLPGHADALRQALRDHAEAQAARLGCPLDARIEVVRGARPPLSEAGDVFVAVGAEAYGDRPDAQAQLLQAKRARVALLAVDGVERGWRAPYDGNLDVVAGQDLATLWSRALDVWVRWQRFRLEGPRVARLARLPDVWISDRPPELFDFADGALAGVERAVVMHPDPEISGAERDALQAAHPGLRLITPTSAYRRLYAGDAKLRGAAPLRDLRVVFSMSYADDVGADAGLLEAHVEDALVQLWRTLLSSGATLAYGGHYLSDGYLDILEPLIQRERVGDPDVESLRYYVPGNLTLADVPARMQALEARTLARATVHEDAQTDAAYHLTAMRREMARDCGPRVTIGGKLRARRGADDRGGFTGRFPGIFEEALFTLQAGKPLYVLGGFGGASARLGALLLGAEPATVAGPEDPLSADQLAFDARPDRAALGLPADLVGLLTAIADAAAPLMAAPEAWNGLSADENAELFATRDPLRAASLVLHGLLALRATAAPEGELAIELVAGRPDLATDLDLLVMPVIADEAAIAARLDLPEAMGARFAAARKAGVDLVELTGRGTRWLYLAALDGPRAATDPKAAIGEAARAAAATVTRYGFQRVGVTTLRHADVPPKVALVETLNGLRGVGGAAEITFFEPDPTLIELLRRAPDVRFSQRAPGPTATSRTPVRRIDVRREGDDVVASVFTPDGTGIFPTRRAPSAALDAVLARCTGRAAPDRFLLPELGSALARALFGDDAEAWLAGDAATLVTHDPEMAVVPFEALRGAGEALAVQAPFSRQLGVDVTDPRTFWARPAAPPPIRVLLVIDPTGDLPGARAEGARVRAVLAGMAEVTLVEGAPKGVDEVLAALADADVLHYCGHARFDPAEPESSGLILSDGPLTQAALAKGAPRLRLIIANACQSGRVRGAPAPAHPTPMGLTELFLRAGVEAFVGTYWEVGDDSAARFAEAAYGALAAGRTLAEAVHAARQGLALEQSGEWVNYIQYGRGDLRLIP